MMLDSISSTWEMTHIYMNTILRSWFLQTHQLSKLSHILNIRVWVYYDYNYQDKFFEENGNNRIRTMDGIKALSAWNIALLVEYEMVNVGKCVYFTLRLQEYKFFAERQAAVMVAVAESPELTSWKSNQGKKR